jgi:glutathione S-transferase
MIDWIPVSRARDLSGLRVVLAKGVWAVWSECAKAMLHYKRLPYAPVPQIIFEENVELVAWTGVRNQPQLIYDDEPARTSWLDIINLLERLAPDPPLLPADPEQRAQVIGWCNELAGENGLGWCRRIQMTATETSLVPGTAATIISSEYGGQMGDVSRAERRIADIVAGIAKTLRRQEALGSQFLVGKTVSAADLYWACFSNLVGPFPMDVCPVPQDLHAGFAQVGSTVSKALDPVIFRHRDAIYRDYLELPLCFG